MHTLPFIVKLTTLGFLKIQGSRAKELLQGQLTCDMNEITFRDAHLGAHCNPQGRIISLFRICYIAPDYFLVMPREMVPIALKALKKYAVFFKVDLFDVSDEICCIGSSGHAINSDKAFQISEKRFILLGDKNEWSKLAKIYEKITIDEWKYDDIINLIPQIYPETSGKFLPHEINLPKLNGVSFNKGCYTGQEIIARMQYRGKLKTHLHKASIEALTPPCYGADIHDNSGKLTGTIVDFCEKEYNKYEILFISQQPPNL